jgi:hypothetical protein
LHGPEIQYDVTESFGLNERLASRVLRCYPGNLQ